MRDATVLVQLSDLHLGPVGYLTHGVDPEANLRRVARAIGEQGVVPDAILLTGDLSDTGCAASYELLGRVVADELVPYGCAVLVGVGNHDHRGTFRQVYLGEPDARDDEPYHHVHDLDGVRLVMCDSYRAGAVTGRLGDTQLAWLDEQLAERGDRAAVVAVHHPSVRRGIPKRHEYLLEDRDRFAEVLARHDVGAVLCGHSHVATAGVFAGTLHVAAPSTAYRYDPSSWSGSAATDEVGMAICTVRDGAVVVNPVMLPTSGVDDAGR
jgi:3',5'-cyclic-AMP phosphodiesterase